MHRLIIYRQPVSKLPDVAHREVMKDESGSEILFVMATEMEYGRFLRANITPLITGVGPIEAALHLGRHLEQLRQNLKLPQVVISLGSAGSRTRTVGSIYQISHVSWRDMDASCLGFEKGATPFLDEPAVIKLLTPLPNLPTATLSTGANVVTGVAYEAIKEDLVDMETYAIARACRVYDLPLISIRGVSDGASSLEGLDDWTSILHLLDEKLSVIVSQIKGARQSYILDLLNTSSVFST
jgi:adenosylhomocysteine nucleosidase